MSVPQPADRLLAEGRQLHALGRLGEAEAAYRAVLTAAPDDHRALACLGILRHQQGEAAAAVELLGRAAAIEPGDVTAWQHLPLPLVALGRHEEAIAAGAVAVRLAPERADVRINHALALISGQRWAEAVPTCETAIALDPQVATAWSQLGFVRHRLGDHAVAVALFDRAIALDPALVEAHVNKGAALQALGRDEEAERAYEAALARDSAHRAARINRGVVQRNLGRIDAAIAGWRAAPERFPELDYNLACALLLKGDWAAGWPGYEHRFETTRPFSRPPATERPRWNGTPMPDGTLLVHVEQGLGDTIQFVRYAPMVRARGARVVLEVQAALAPLLARQGLADAVVARGASLPAFDVHCPLMSLPRAFGTRIDTVPAPARYLSADPARVADWTARLGPRTRPRIGVVWSGAPTRLGVAERSVPLDTLAALLDEAFDWIALQHEVRDADREALAATPRLRGFGDALRPFDEVAAAMEAVDAVVGVDTALTHLAAALGRPTLVLLPERADWRWHEGRDDSPWYPSATLVRQHAHDRWEVALRRARLALHARFVAGL